MCEASTKGAQDIVKVEPTRDKTAEEVHAVARRSTDERTSKCFGCGRRNHSAVSVRNLNQCVIIVA